MKLSLTVYITKSLVETELLNINLSLQIIELMKDEFINSVFNSTKFDYQSKSNKIEIVNDDTLLDSIIDYSTF